MPFLFFNPFSHRLVQAARRRVETLRGSFPDLGEQELARKLITERAALCAVVGAATALPAIVPGIGTLVAILAGVAVDIMVLGVLLYRLVLELAVVYGRDPFSGEVQQEALRVFALAAGVEAAAKKAARYTAGHLAGWSGAALHRPLVQFGFRASQRSLLPRVVPLLGVVAAGGLTYLFARTVGHRILKYYEADAARHGTWTGRTIDADCRVIQ